MAALTPLAWYVVDLANSGPTAPPPEPAMPAAALPIPPGTGKAWVIYKRQGNSPAWVKTQRVFPDAESCFKAEDTLNNSDWTYVYDCNPM